MKTPSDVPIQRRFFAVDNDGSYRIEFIVGTVKQDPGETLGLFMVEMKPSGSTKP